MIVPDSSPINRLVIANLVPTFIAHAGSCLEFYLSTTDPNVAHPQSVSCSREVFEPVGSHLPSHTPAPNFMRLSHRFLQSVAERNVYSLVQFTVTLSLTQTTFHCSHAKFFIPVQI